jgi:hypothetical protein
MRREPYDWFIAGAYDWSIKSWNPPVEEWAFPHYAFGWDYIWPDESYEEIVENLFN